MRRPAFICFLTLTLASPTHDALAQTARSNQQGEARRHFREGLAKAAQGDVQGALTEFETAYTIQPHFSVLYNIGQARTALGKPVEAIDAFERYLADGAGNVSPERRQEVTTLIATNRERFGVLRITADTSKETRIWLDGTRFAQTSLGRPLPLAVGEHSIIFWNPSGAPQSQSVLVTTGKTTDVILRARVKPTLNAQLAITCSVPDVEVEIMGVRRGKTPFQAPLLLAPGATNVRFSRPGYEATTSTITTIAEHLTALPCNQRPLSPLPGPLAARLSMRTTPSDAIVLVDGRPFHDGPLASGLHTVRVERDGFVPHEHTVSIVAGKTTLQDERLTPTASTLARDRESAGRRRTAGLALGGAGAVFLGVGAGLFVWNTNRYDDWQTERATSTVNHNLDRATSIQRADDIAVGLALAGAGLALGGTWLLLTRD